MTNQVKKELEAFENEPLKMNEDDAKTLVKKLSVTLRAHPLWAKFNLPGDVVGLTKRFRLQGEYRRTGKKFEVRRFLVVQQIPRQGDENLPGFKETELFVIWPPAPETKDGARKIQVLPMGSRPLDPNSLGAGVETESESERT